METTLAVNVTLKINTSGDTPNELICNAVHRAVSAVSDALGSTWDEGEPDISVEGAAPLVNREALLEALGFDNWYVEFASGNCSIVEADSKDHARVMGHRLSRIPGDTVTRVSPATPDDMSSFQSMGGKVYR